MADLSHSQIDPAVARRNKRVALGGLFLAAGMVGLAYASVPLYQLFCQITGYGGR
jgi:cytochrome c oxidase assembly protein subunit 11